MATHALRVLKGPVLVTSIFGPVAREIPGYVILAIFLVYVLLNLLLSLELKYDVIKQRS